MIEAEGILKSFGGLQVLKGIDLAVRAGEVAALVGSSGAGKTTLLQILGTLNRPDAGRLRIGGTELASMGERKLAEFRNRRIGFVFQFHHLLPEFTALENVCMPGLIAGTPRRQVEARARELLGLLSLADRVGHKPNQLSGGEQQRVAVARALLNSPDVVLADEPSGNLDSANKKELHDLFFRLRDQFGQTFLIVTHDEGLARLADRTILIRDGRIVADGAA